MRKICAELVAWFYFGWILGAPGLFCWCCETVGVVMASVLDVVLVGGELVLVLLFGDRG